MGLCFHLVRTCVFYDFWRQHVALVKEGCILFRFESYGMALNCPFMISRSGKNERPS